MSSDDIPVRVTAGRRPDFEAAVGRWLGRRVRDAQLWLLDGDGSMRRVAPTGRGRGRTLPVTDDPRAWPSTSREGERLPPTWRPVVEGSAVRLAAASVTAPESEERLGVLMAPLASARMSRLTTLAEALGVVLADRRAYDAARSRADRLSALYEGAHEMSAALDTDKVLRTICARARAVMSADLVYIMLLDPRGGEGRLIPTDGVRVEDFDGWTMPASGGLIGRIFETGQPFHTSDYMTDHRFQHYADESVRAEGIVASLGVPLVSGGEIIGVLLANYRTTRDFTEDDVALLESLAEHAAVASTNARLYEQTEEALRNERELRDLSERQARQLEEADRLHGRLTGALLSDVDLDGLLAEVSDAIGVGVSLAADEPDDGHAVQVGTGSLGLGWLVVEADDSFDTATRHQLEQAARVVAIRMLRDRAVAQAHYRAIGELVDELLAAPPDAIEEVLRRASLLDLELGGDLAVVCLLPDGDQDDPLEIVDGALRRLRRGSFAVSRQGGIMAVMPATTDPVALARQLVDRIAEDRGGPYTVGVARGRVVVSDLGSAFREAVSAAKAARAAGLTVEVVTLDDLGLSGALALEEGSEIRSMADRLLRPLRDYDQKRRSNLVETLETYLDAAGNATEAARRLHLHVNSLYYRLTRIRELGGYDLGDPEVRFELQLALRVVRMGEGT